MNDNDRIGGAAVFLYMVFALLVYAVIIVLKAAGVIAWSWALVLTSIVWAPIAVLALLLLVLMPYALIRAAIKKGGKSK